MKHTNGKYSLFFVMVLVAVLSILAFPAMAEEITDGDVDVAAFQARVDAILDTFGITDGMTDVEIADAIIAADSVTIEAIMAEMDALNTDAQHITEADLVKLDITLYERFCNVWDCLFRPEFISAVNMLSDTLLIEDTKNTGSATGTTTYTATATTSGVTRATNKITITNKSGTTAELSFHFEATNIDKESSARCTIDGTEYSNGAGSASGDFVKTLEAGASIEISIVSRRFTLQSTATLTLTNISLVAAADKSDVTINFASSAGSVKVDGTAITSGSVNEITSAGATLVATPVSGASFLGWIDEDGKLKSSDATYTLVPTGDMTITAAFASSGSNAWFLTNGLYYNDLHQATAKAAASTTDKTVVLAANGTLPARKDTNGNDIEVDYTIPSGVTLLIPFDSANTICTENPTTHDDAYTAPTVYRTLTMAEGANITVNGAISVSGKVSSKYGCNGMPSGPLGFIHMNSGSNITVNSGANLYVWGYIKGSGSVTVNSGGTVHECFQIADYRGGDATSTIVSNADNYGVFPFNQYYLQNVEVPMTLYAGATEKGFGAVTVTLAGTQKMSIPFIGASGSMFVIDSGYIVKDYMEGTGRTEIKVYGDMTVTPVSIDMRVALIGSITIDTNKYALPIPNHMTISLESGSINMNQSMAFLPGSELYIREGTTCTLGSGKNIYVYDWDNWIYNDGANGYAGTTNLPYVNLPYVPGGKGTTGRSKDALVQIDGTVDVSAGSAYVTAGGANIYSTGTGVVTVGSATKTAVYQVITNSTDISSWPEITIQPAILLNADGTEVATTEAGTYTYYASIGRWDKPSHFFEGGICTVCGIRLFTIKASQIYLGNNLNMGFRFVYNGAETDNLSGYTVKLTHDVADNQTIPEVTYAFDNWYTDTDENGTFYYVVYEGLAARRMCDTITLTVYSGNTPVSNTWTDSMQAYAMRMLADTTDADAEKRTVLVDMLNYGAEAQIHFKYNTGTLANAELTDAQKAYATATVPDRVVPESSLGGNWRKSNLVTTSSIQFLLAIEGLNLNSNVTVSYTNHRDVSKNPSPIIGQAGDYYYVAIEELVVADAWCLVTVTVDGVEYKDSIAGYLKRYTGKSAVYDAYWKFADSAYAYFHPDK